MEGDSSWEEPGGGGQRAVAVVAVWGKDSAQHTCSGGGGPSSRGNTRCPLEAAEVPGKQCRQPPPCGPCCSRRLAMGHVALWFLSQEPGQMDSGQMPRIHMLPGMGFQRGPGTGLASLDQDQTQSGDYSCVTSPLEPLC